MDKWIWKKFRNIDYITVPAWEGQGVNIGFSGRYHGQSQGPYASLNMGLHVGDNYEDVMANRRNFMHAFNLELDNMVCCEQVHSSRVVKINEKDAGKGALSLNTALPGLDGMVTGTPGLMLVSFYADCIPVFFYDPSQRVVAVAHSGWKGTMDGIAVNTINVMKGSYACKPGDIQVFIGPGIGPCCFQIQEDLYQKVCKLLPDFDVMNLKNGQIYWDLRLTIRKMLTNSGIKPDNVIECNLCSSCRTDLFFSYRKENGITGRMAAAIGLKY